MHINPMLGGGEEEGGGSGCHHLQTGAGNFFPNIEVGAPFAIIFGFPRSLSL